MTRWFCLALLVFGGLASAQEPVKIDLREIWDHRTAPLKSIHANLPAAERLYDTIKLQVIVDAAGNVESAQAVNGPSEFFTQAEAIEYKRKFKPFEKNGEPIRASLEDYVSIVPPEQWAETSVPFPEIKDWNSLRIHLKRTSCYGSCPDYAVEVSGNGDVDFNGVNNVFITGHHRGQISSEAVRELVETFRRTHYFSLKDLYLALITDNPTYTTSIEFDGIKKSVTDYVGLQVGMPEVVTELEDAIDRIAGAAKWIKGNEQTGPALVREKWDFHGDNEENRALFAQVIASGSEDLIQLFLKNGAPVLSMTKDGEGPLISAAGKGDFELTKHMLSNESTPSAALLSCTLGAAARSGNLELVQFLILKGADPNGPPCGRYGKVSVLMQATASGKPEIVEAILKYHPALEESLGQFTPLTYFLERAPTNVDTQKILSLLVTAGADVNKPEHDGATPLDYACTNQHPEAVRALIAAGADVNAKGRYGQTVLMSCFDKACLKILIDSGADLNIRNRDGHTAAEQARQMGALDKAELLETAMKQRGDKQ